MTSAAQSNDSRGFVGARLGRYALGGALVATALAFVPFGHNPFGPVKLLALLASAALAALALALDPRASTAPLAAARRMPALWALGGLAALGVLSTALSDDLRTSLLGAYPEYVGVLELFAGLVLAWAAVAFLAEEDAARRWSRVAVVAVLAVGMYAAVQALGLDPLVYRSTLIVARVRSTLGNASNLGVWLLLALPLSALVALGDSSRAWRVVARVACALGAWTLVATGSRGAIVGAVVGLAVGAGLAVRDARKGAVALGAAAALAALVVAVGALMPRDLATSLAEGTVTWRLAVWQEAARLAMVRPFLGSGISTFAARFGGVPGDSGLGPAIPASAHNLPLDAAVSSGWLALVLMLACVLLLARDVWRVRGARDRAMASAAAGLAGAFAALQFHFLTLDTIAAGAVVLGVLVGRLEALSPAPEPARDPVPARAPRWVAAVIAVLLGVSALAGGALVVADAHVARALRLAPAGPWTPVASALQSAQSLAPWEPAMWLAEGRAARASVMNGNADGAYNDGVAAYEHASALLPTSPSLLAERAGLELAQSSIDPSRADPARVLYTELAEVAPWHAQAWLGLGWLHMLDSETDEAIAAYERAVKLAPGEPAAWQELGDAYAAASRDADAESARARAQELLEAR